MKKIALALLAIAVVSALVLVGCPTTSPSSSLGTPSATDLTAGYQTDGTNIRFVLSATVGDEATGQTGTTVDAYKPLGLRHHGEFWNAWTNWEWTKYPADGSGDYTKASGATYYATKSILVSHIKDGSCDGTWNGGTGDGNYEWGISITDKTGDKIPDRVRDANANGSTYTIWNWINLQSGAQAIQKTNGAGANLSFPIANL